MTILDDVSKKTEENEFFNSMPEGYVKGKTKYVVVTGTVMSGWEWLHLVFTFYFSYKILFLILFFKFFLKSFRHCY